MAIALDSATDGSSGGGTYAHTVSGSNRMLLVSVLGGAAFGDNITGVTYDSVSMTLAGKSAVSGDRWNYLFYLVAPNTGTHNIVISDGGSGSGATTAVSYTGVNQTVPEVIQVTDGTDSGGKVQALTTLSTGAWLAGAMHADAGPTASTNTTFRGDRFYDTNGSQGVSGSYSMALTWSGTVGWAYIMVSLAPYKSIAFDASTYAAFGPVTGFTQAHTCTGTDRFLVVMFGINDGDFCSGVTYGGVAMTQQKKQVTALGDCLYIYTLANPASGANNVVMTTSSGSSHYSDVGIQSYSYVKQSSIDGTAGTVGAGVTSQTVSITTTIDNDWLVGLCRTSTTQTASTNTRKRGAVNLNSFFDTTGAQTPTGSKSMISTFASSYADFIAIAFSPNTGDNYPMTASVGSFTLTGNDSLFYQALNMIASAGSFILSGFDALFSLGKGIIAETGSFILTGYDAVLHVIITMVASAGSFTMTGFDSVLTKGYNLIAGLGSFILTGFNVRLPRRWTNQSKNSATWSNQSKNSSSWSNESKTDI